MHSITVVCATRMREDDFVTKSLLGKTIAQYSKYPVKWRIFFSNAKGLGSCYNEVIRGAASADEILIFVHDDVLILDFFWLDKIIAGFAKFDILGVAGNKRRRARQPSWAFIDDKFTWDERSNLSGVVGHGSEFPCQLSVFGPYNQECKLLDGVLLATKKGILERSQVSFDEQFDFNFYDLDLCRQAEKQRLRLGTIPLGIVHASAGNFGTDRWRAGYKKYLEKWLD